MIYAIVDKDGKVIDSIVADESFEPRLKEIFQGKEVVKSENTKESKTCSIGGYYDKTKDYFAPYKSWTIDNNGEYEQKKTYPKDGKNYTWNEKTKTWDLVKTEIIKDPIKK